YPNARPLEIDAGVGDPGVAEDGIEFQRVEQNLDAVRHLQGGAAFDVDDAQQPPVALGAHLDQIRVVVGDADQGGVEVVLPVEAGRGPQGGLVDGTPRLGGAQQGDGLVETVPALVQLDVALRNVDPASQQLCDDLRLPAASALQDGPHEWAAVEVVV